MLVIRRATRGDVSSLLTLVKELAAYERQPEAVVASEADFLRDGFGEEPLFHAHVATWDDEVIGFALWFVTYSTWVGRGCLYLEDVFVRPAFRGRGAGVGLMKALAREAKDRDCRRFVWQVLDWNEPAIAFYERLGANVMHEWLTVRIEGEALASLAESRGE